MSKNIYFIGWLAMVLLVSCSEGYFTQSYALGEGWQKDNDLEFTINIEEPKKEYDLYFVVRNTDDYPFRNLILFTELEGSIDTLYYDLADKNGQWIGTGWNTKELNLEFKHNYHFETKGEKSLKVTQAMRKDTLYGISDFTVWIDKKN